MPYILWRAQNPYPRLLHLRKSVFNSIANKWGQALFQSMLSNSMFQPRTAAPMRCLWPFQPIRRHCQTRDPGRLVKSIIFLPFLESPKCSSLSSISSRECALSIMTPPIKPKIQGQSYPVPLRPPLGFEVLLQSWLSFIIVVFIMYSSI